MTVDTKGITRLARLGKALSDPIRLRMLDVLARGRDCCGLPDLCTRDVPGSDTPAGICVCEFQEQFGLSQSHVSYHLRVLRDAGLVTEETRGKWTFYDLDRKALGDALDHLQRLTVGETTAAGRSRRPPDDHKVDPRRAKRLAGKPQVH